MKALEIGVLAIDTNSQVFATALGDLIVGSDIYNDPYVEMQIVELVLYDRALLASEPLQLQGYFKSKYDLDNN